MVIINPSKSSGAIQFYFVFQRSIIMNTYIYIIKPNKKTKALHDAV